VLTGAAGFIGFHVAARLLDRGDEVVGLDNRSPYYDVRLKDARLALLKERSGFTFHEVDLADRAATARVFAEAAPAAVVHLAAQAGVRYSLENPAAYVDANLVGFANVLEACRQGQVGHLLYASSSSVYGANTRVPFSTHDNVDHPVSLYAATKKANELMAHAYSHLFNLPTTGLRFFTVYGPWGRPDMAYYKFTEAILAGRPIEVYGEGRMRRDFTFIDDVVDAVVRLLDRPPAPDPAWSAADPDPASSAAPYRVYNIGGSRPVELGRFIDVLEDTLGVRAERRLLPMQPGDVAATWADVADLEAAIGVVPQTPIEEGLARFVAWYRDVYGPAGELVG
jgi:UDP-glucuronate 4-epimerase